jgi:hypothetical protein
MSMLMTVEQLRDALPAKVKKGVNQELIDQINAVLSEPELYESYRDNLVSYTSVMQDGKFTMEQYVNAVKYVSHKLMGCTNIDAYSRTFPQKIIQFNTQGVQAKDVASYVTAYNKSKLVNLIFAQTMIPTHVLNQDLFQKALNQQAHLMMHAKSEKVQSDAAAHLMNALKPPETKKIELDIGIKEDSAIALLRQSTMELVAAQRLAIQSGVQNAEQVAHSKITPTTVDNETGEIV